MKFFRIILLAGILSSLFGCGATTKITRSWRDPTSTISKSDTGKVLVLAMVIDAYSRRVVEDGIVKQIGARAIPSYLIFTDDMLKSLPQDVFTDKVKRDKYQYVFLMRLKDVEKETYYVPGSNSGYYGGYGMYYGYSISLYNTPGYYATDRKYTVETTVYSVEPDKLLWTGTSTTDNPDKLKKAVEKYGDAVSFQMRRDGFLK